MTSNPERTSSLRVLRSISGIAATVLCGTLVLGRVSAQPARPPIEELQALRPVIDTTGFTGTVLVYDLTRDHWSGVHGETADVRRIPASTYKIVNAMVSLETRVIASDAAVIAWDGVVRDRLETNTDLTLAEAFRLSAVPHFQTLARTVGQARMQEWVDRIGYGNRDLSGGIDQFWLTGGLRISPREQIELLVRLFQSKLPFSERTMRIVRMIMEVERTPAVVVRAKTGFATLPGQRIGWWVGWVERGDETYFFATVLEHPVEAASFLPARIDVTKSVLRALHVLEP